MIENSPELSAQLFIPKFNNYVGPAKNFVRSFAEGHAVPADVANRIEFVTEQILELLMREKSQGISDVPISINLKSSSTSISLELSNKGMPIFEEDIELGNFKSLSDEFHFENLGRDGQLFRSVYALTNALAKAEITIPELEEEESVEFRLMEASEANALSKLFYKVYGHNYINDWIYYPNEIRKRLINKDIISLIATTKKGKLLGHVALVKYNNAPVVYDVGLGIVDPYVKSKGIFKKLFSQMMVLIGESRMQYCVYDMVTNHEFSQREVFRYPTCVMSLSVGLQVAKTQASLEKLGIGKDPIDMDRYSILMAIRPGVENPFGTDLILPVSLGERLEFLLKAMNVNWAPASRFFPLAQEGYYKVRTDLIQKAVYFDFLIPGHDAVSKIIQDWKQFQRLGYQYGAIDIPLNHPGIGILYGLFQQNGFFLSGFVPYHFTEQLALRLQCLGPTRVSWENIKLYGPEAVQLLNVIKQDYERNAFI